MIEKIIKNIEHKTGLKIYDNYKLNPKEISQKIEQKTGKTLSFSSELPYIRRGNVLRDGLVEHQQINGEIDSILGIVICD